MKQTAVIIAPGRGTYNRSELGYLARHHGDKTPLLNAFDSYRQDQQQESISALDSAERFSVAKHTRGDNASGLIYACAYADFLSINRDCFDIIGVTGNSMGWYVALACAGALGAMGGFEVVNTMGTLMQQSLIGGQLIYPFVDENWVEIPHARQKIESKLAEINARSGHMLALSIDLGGMLVIAGNEAGLSAFEAEMPPVQDRFPLRLPNHAGFHTSLQAPVAALGQAQLPLGLFHQPELPLIDGRGALWYPDAVDLSALRNYTLGHQVTQTYDFTGAIRTAARELMPDVFIVLGPGTTLGGAVAQSFLQAEWRGMSCKADFLTAQAGTLRLISMGHADQRDQTAGDEA